MIEPSDLPREADAEGHEHGGEEPRDQESADGCERHGRSVPEEAADYAADTSIGQAMPSCSHVCLIVSSSRRSSVTCGRYPTTRRILERSGTRRRMSSND